jgi:AbiV family abortive infection protein
VKPKTVDATIREVELGAELCRENTRRFIRNARILLEHHGSDGLAYVLWSFAVEELGKGVLLREQVPADVQPEDRVAVELSMDHREKFVAGVRSVPGLDRQRFESLLRVTSNFKRQLASSRQPAQDQQ